MTAAIPGPILDDIEALLRAEAVGEDSAISSGEISDRVVDDTHDTNPKTRDAILTLMTERNVPVAASHNGYYVPAGRGELEDYLSRLDGRIAGIQARKYHVCEAWNNDRSGDDVDPGEPGDVSSGGDGGDGGSGPDTPTESSTPNQTSVDEWVGVDA